MASIQSPIPSVQHPAQRLRILYAKGDALKYISHLDLARTWERAFRRAALPLAYSQGFSPRPRFQIAAALPVGVIGEAELLDVWLAEPLAPAQSLARLRCALPPGLVALDASEVDLRAPSLQSQMSAADYLAVVACVEPVEALRNRVQALLGTSTLLRRREHKGGWQTYDLRSLILDMTVESGAAGTAVLAMRLRSGPLGAGRPDEVLDALGLRFSSHSVRRTRLYWSGASEGSGDADLEGANPDAEFDK